MRNMEIVLKKSILSILVVMMMVAPMNSSMIQYEFCEESVQYISSDDGGRTEDLPVFF